MTEPKRLLALGIDAASPTLLREWAADGTLPNIARLMADGLVAELRGPDAFFVGSTWPSFSTGRNAAGHGIYWLEQLKSGTYRTAPLPPEAFGTCKTLWEYLSDAGRQVLVLDVPLSVLSPGLNGVQVVEWRTHDVLSGMATTPPSLKARILQRFGEHPGAAPCDAPRRSLAEYLQFGNDLVRGATMRGQLTIETLAEHPWDFAIQVFNEAHCAGHQLWHFHDPAHPEFDPATTKSPGDPVKNVYRAIDAAIGNILEHVDAGTTMVLFSLHGMSYWAGSSRLLPEMLTRLGMTVPPPRGKPAGALTVREWILYLLRTPYHWIPESIRRPFYDARARFRRDILDRGTDLQIDPRRSRCFAIDMGPLIGAIRLNLIGREPSGILAPGQEADAFCAELTEMLLEFVDPTTGRQLVRRVLRTADLYQGERIDDLPDLVVEWDRERPIGSVNVGTGAGATIRGHSARTGLIEVINEYARTGDHRIEGMLVARGPGIASGQLGRVVSTLDLAPTLAALLGSDMPDVDGMPIPELIGN